MLMRSAVTAARSPTVHYPSFAIAVELEKAKLLGAQADNPRLIVAWPLAVSAQQLAERDLTAVRIRWVMYKRL